MALVRFNGIFHDISQIAWNGICQKIAAISQSKSPGIPRDRISSSIRMDSEIAVESPCSISNMMLIYVKVNIHIVYVPMVIVFSSLSFYSEWAVSSKNEDLLNSLNRSFMCIPTYIRKWSTTIVVSHV